MPEREIYRPLPSETVHVEAVRKLIRESLNVLKLSQPDPLLGRQTYQPFATKEPKD